jgi:hypothetical protein
MNSRLTPILTLRNLTLLLMMALLGAYSLHMAVHSTAQSPIAEERKLTNKVPRHLPIKIKVRKLNNEKWLDDLEVEVQNISNKPIYLLNFFLLMPEIRDAQGNAFGFPLKYGRIELVDYETPLEPTDVPIKPGESYIYKVDLGEIKGWGKYKAENGKPEPKEVELIFSQLNFGDGTGFTVTSGVPINIRKTSSITVPCAKPTSRSKLSPALESAALEFPPLRKTEFFMSKISFSGSPRDPPSSLTMPQPDLCGCHGDCNYRKNSFYRCSCKENALSTTSVPCTDPSGVCSNILVIPTFCVELQVGCPEYTLAPCFAEGCDEDGDLHASYTCGGDDCDDSRSDVNPDETENCFDTVDNDCKFGADCADIVSCDPNFGHPECEPSPTPECDDNCHWWAAENRCRCVSPILVDVVGNGFALTDLTNGVDFNFFGDGATHISWTAAGSDDAFLVLDRNNNGRIDNGMELFGNLSPQPISPNPNGFLALAEYDKPANGGNGDGFITHTDQIFSSLRLWQDSNHNGASEPRELHTLPAFELRKIELDFRESRRTDQFGNRFKYRAKVKDTQDAQLGRWAWDVFFISGP